MSDITVSVIGCGSMGGAVIRAVCGKYDPKTVTISAKHFEHAQNLAFDVKCTAVDSNAKAAAAGKYVFIAVKPAYVADVMKEIAGVLRSDAVVISMAAGLSLEKLRTMTDRPVVRIMPNMPAQIGEAMTALSCGDDVEAGRLADITALLECAGKVEKVDEKLMDCVTAVSGSGPAYVFMFIEALADAAVRFGMPRAQAYVYAAQTVKGSASMALADERCPAALKDAVCSPAGTTIEGVAALEKDGFRNAVFDAVKAAYDKSVSMGKK
ncbi:MAG TPA: pyrroline-5-carboxylate reductase [Treponema sp.]|nr:pyrroline-5-carboxylate reductase [Treponema sp.]